MEKEASDTEMFRAVELEQTSIESMHRKEEELQRMLPRNRFIALSTAGDTT